MIGLCRAFTSKFEITRDTTQRHSNVPSMRDSSEKTCVTMTIVTIVLLLCIILGICIYAYSRPTSDVKVLTSSTPHNTSIPNLLTKAAIPIVKPLRTVTISAETDDDIGDITKI